MTIITKETLKRKIEDSKPFVLLDVRTPSEFSSGNIPQSHNVPVQQLSQDFSLDEDSFEKKNGFKKPGKDEEIVVYCKMGGRATMAYEALKQMGYSHVLNYKGSWLDWTS